VRIDVPKGANTKPVRRAIRRMGIPAVFLEGRNDTITGRDGAERSNP
jgi:hypothetical protein